MDKIVITSRGGMLHKMVHSLSGEPTVVRKYISIEKIGKTLSENLSFNSGIILKGNLIYHAYSSGSHFHAYKLPERSARILFDNQEYAVPIPERIWLLGSADGKIKSTHIWAYDSSTNNTFYMPFPNVHGSRGAVCWGSVKLAGMSNANIDSIDKLFFGSNFNYDLLDDEGMFTEYLDLVNSDEFDKELYDGHFDSNNMDLKERIESTIKEISL